MYSFEDLFDMRSVVGAKLESLMKETGYSKTRLCKEAGVSRPTLDKLLAGTITSAATFERHIQKILDCLHSTPDMLIGKEQIVPNRVRALRQIMRTHSDELALATGLSAERLLEIETGDDATPSELRDIAFHLSTGTSSILNENIFELQFSTLNYFMVSDKETLGAGCGFWGHLGIQLAGDEMYYWFPITENTCRQIRHQVQTMHKIVIPCMNNKLLFVNLDNTKQILLLDEACDQPSFTNWDPNVDCGEIPLVIYESLGEFFDWAEEEKTPDPEIMSQSFFDTMKKIVEDKAWNEDSVYQMEQIILHHTDGKKTATSFDYHQESSLLCEIERLYAFDDDSYTNDWLDYEDWDNVEILINMNKTAMIELPLTKAEAAIQHMIEMDE